MVEPAGRHRPGNQHQEGPAGELEAVGPGRGDSVDGREDDVRPEAEGDGAADLRRAEEAGHAPEVHVRSPGDGLFEMQIQLNSFPADSFQTCD